MYTQSGKKKKKKEEKRGDIRIDAGNFRMQKETGQNCFYFPKIEHIFSGEISFSTATSSNTPAF